MEFDAKGILVRAEVETKDGAKLTVRPPAGEDRDKLEQMFRSCSDETLYTRFLSPGLGVPLRFLDRLMKHTPPAVCSFIAVTTDEEEKVAGLMNYVQIDGPGQGEIAIVVTDEYQNRGLGSAMLDSLYAMARQMKISRFVADIDATNRRVFHLIQRSGFPCNYTVNQGVAHVEMEIG